jgi:cytochrome c-type biogenesis protein CcmE
MNMTTQEIEIAAIPAELRERAQKQARSGVKKSYIIGGVVVLGFIAVVLAMTLMTGSYWLTVSELQADASRYAGENVRVSGAVLQESADWNPQEVTLRFIVSDESGAQLPIVFFGPRPDNFVRATEAIVEGRLLPDGSFQADNLLLKCPSRYDEEPVYVEATHT